MMKPSPVAVIIIDKIFTGAGCFKDIIIISMQTFWIVNSKCFHLKLAAFYIAHT